MADAKYNDQVNERGLQLVDRLRGFQNLNEISAFSVKEKSDNEFEVWLSFVGREQPNAEVENFIKHPPPGTTVMEDRPLNQDYYFLAGGELRPGSGIIRRTGGVPQGPAGTLTCFLTSKDSREHYFAAAAHVVSNFWKDCKKNPEGSIYINRKGYPNTKRSRFLGKIIDFTDSPLVVAGADTKQSSVTLDLGIVKLRGDYILKQQTTGYGTFGEWPEDPDACKEDQEVMKCGAEETHWTAAYVLKPAAEVTVYGQDGKKYKLFNQVILGDLPVPKSSPVPEYPSQTPPPKPSEPPKKLPDNPDGTPFAVSGDSGTLVVDRDTKRPLGMLIAGSILNGRYVMTPFGPLKKYWEEKHGLLMPRA